MMKCGRLLMCVLWPAFLAACLMELLIFALVDPGDLRWAGHGLGLSRQTIYALGFFVFWVLASVASALTVMVMLEPGRQTPLEPARSTEPVSCTPSD